MDDKYKPGDEEIARQVREALEGTPEPEDSECEDCEGCLEHQDECPQEAPWGAHPCDEGTTPCEPEVPKIGAEQIMLKMHTEEGEPIEVNLLQVVNQMFMDMGHIHMRLLGIEKALKLIPEEEEQEEGLILMPDTDIETV